jgi:hypothetical protein
MKTEWEFRFTAEGLVFREERRFRAQLTRSGGDKARTSNTIEDIRICIVPKNEKAPRGASSGKILITLHGSPEETETVARVVVFQLKERLEFPHARITLSGFMIIAKAIPETHEEEEQLGDLSCYVTLRFEEVPIDPEFQTHLIGRPTPEYITLLAQFNVAKRLESAPDRFLAFFKVLERAYAPDTGGNLLKALRANDSLWNVAQRVLKPEFVDTRDKFNESMKKLIRIRGNCAHLGRRTGYVVGDPGKAAELERYLIYVIALAGETVDRHRQG